MSGAPSGAKATSLPSTSALRTPTGGLGGRNKPASTLIPALTADEVLLGDGVGAHAVDTRQQDRVAADGDQHVVAEIGDQDAGCKIGRRDPQARQIDQVLAARRVGVEAD